MNICDNVNMDTNDNRVVCAVKDAFCFIIFVSCRTNTIIFRGIRNTVNKPLLDVYIYTRFAPCDTMQLTLKNDFMNFCRNINPDNNFTCIFSYRAVKGQGNK